MGHRSFFKHDAPSRVATKRQAKADEAELDRAVCKAVDERDRYRCRVCGRRCNPSALDMLQKAHRHHITYRSAGGATSSDNVVTLCADCHSEEHAHRLAVRGNADTGIEVWKFAEATGWYLVRRELAPHVVERD
jgi:5-methylcytosine-specific restriction endonuclease McrA